MTLNELEWLLYCRGFKQDCPDGQLSKDKILEMYSMILPAGNAKVFVDQIFRIFDKDGNGSIDFKVICNVSCTAQPLQPDRLQQPRPLSLSEKM